MKRAIIYYSLTDNTKEAAEYIAAKTGYDIFRIETVKSMPDSMGKQMMKGGMQATFGMKPEIKGLPDNIAEYDEIILGTPVWAGKNASPINTVLKSEEVRNKIIAVFTFSGGGDNDKCIAKLKKRLPAMKENVALADRNHPSAADNTAKIDEFIEEL